MTYEYPTQNENLNEHLHILANPYHRAVLSYFQNTSKDTVSLNTLATELASEDTSDAETLSTKLRHSAFTRLEEANALEYDEGADIIYYHGHTELETLLNKILD